LSFLHEESLPVKNMHLWSEKVDSLFFDQRELFRLETNRAAVELFSSVSLLKVAFVADSFKFGLEKAVKLVLLHFLETIYLQMKSF